MGMPRPNKGRRIGREEYLAQRVQALREERGYTYEGVAKRMRDMGCQIQASAIFKIEKSEPRRRITVDELYAFAHVFDVPVDELMVSHEGTTMDEQRMAQVNKLAANIMDTARAQAAALYDLDGRPDVADIVRRGEA